MDQQVRRIAARYGIALSEEEIARIAQEAEAQEKVLAELYKVSLDQTRPLLGITHSRAETRQQARKHGSTRKHGSNR